MLDNGGSESTLSKNVIQFRKMPNESSLIAYVGIQPLGLKRSDRYNNHMYKKSYRYINKDIKHINKPVKYINKYVNYTDTYLNKTYTFT